jgi:amidase
MTAVVDEVISRENFVWSFGPDMAPLVAVEPGAVLRFETNDCFTSQIRSEDDLVTEIDPSRINGATGPVAVRGAEPGDSLVVELLEVNPAEWGVATIIPGFGQLIESVRAPVTKLFRVSDGVVEMDERISFPARPMVGVVGVATAGETLSNGLAGEHGGNLDSHLHGPGARIYLPVRQPGGLFAVGDMHASMGEGDVCFTGVEIAGEVVVRLDLVKGKQGRWPVTELPDRWATHGTGPGCRTRAASPARRPLACSWTSGPHDGGRRLHLHERGVRPRHRACKPAPGLGAIARMAVPKLDATPAPFRT